MLVLTLWTTSCRIGGGHRDVDYSLLIAINDVVLRPIEGDRLGYIPVGVVKGQCGGGDRGLIVISRAEVYRDCSIGAESRAKVMVLE